MARPASRPRYRQRAIQEQNKRAKPKGSSKKAVVTPVKPKRGK